MRRIYHLLNVTDGKCFNVYGYLQHSSCLQMNIAPQIYPKKLNVTQPDKNAFEKGQPLTLLALGRSFSAERITHLLLKL